MALAARWAATVVVLAAGSAVAVVGSEVAVCVVVLAIVVCAAVVHIFVAPPRLVGVMWSKIR